MSLPPGFEDPVVKEIDEVRDTELYAAEVCDPPPGFAVLAAASGESFDPKPRSTPEDIYGSDMTFQDLELKPEILDALLLDFKFERPSSIQATTLPNVLRHPDRHMIAQGHNGSGKTTCFTVAMLMRCAQCYVLVFSAPLATYNAVISKAPSSIEHTSWHNQRTLRSLHAERAHRIAA
jgi:hypothetical protein